MILEGAATAGLAAALHAQCFPPGERWDEAAMAALLAVPGSFACVVMGAGSLPAGLALVRVAADEAELLTLGVLPEARRQGVARRLLGELTGAAAARGAVRLFLEVSVANAAALALYLGLGFDELGRRRQYYPDGTDALLLARDIGVAGARSSGISDA
ncbi:GNAT family N-acetyltransferase [Lichenicola sp.]|uniref:GNAT family N-acetyltransferase n=1 Tax=Lichenicola sp. TaxID=2804529 RepID=UPI003B0057C7